MRPRMNVALREAWPTEGSSSPLKIPSHPLRNISTALRRPTRNAAVLLSLFFIAVISDLTQAQLCVQLNGGTYTQNFNTLAASGSSNNSSTLPIGFAFSEAGLSRLVTCLAAVPPQCM